MKTTDLPQVTLSHIIASSTPRQKKDAFAKITSWIRCVVYSVHAYFATGDDILAIVQHSDIHGAPYYKLRPFAFGFNKVLMAG